MTGAALAVLVAFTFGFGAIFQRRAVIRVRDAAAGVLISVPISVPFFMLVLIVTGQVSSIASFSWQSYGWLSAAGILHFVVGRSLSYKLIQLVGVNVAEIVRRVQPLVTVILGISVLGEPLSWQLAAGVLLIVCGLLVAGVNPRIFRGGRGLFSGIPGKAYLLGVGAGLVWGTTPILIKLGLGGSGSPVAGAFISFSAATIVLSTFLWNPDKRATLVGMKGRPAGFFCLAGLFAATAQLMQYTALSIAPASVVTPIVATSPVFILLFSFLFNRKLEVFSMNVITGIIAVVAGSILLI